MLGALKNLFGGKDGTPHTEYWVGDIGLTLMMYDNNLEAHVQSEIRRYDYFFKLSSALRKDMTGADFEARLRKVIHEVYQRHRLHFQQAEPNDPNYIAIADAGFRPLSAAEAAARPWLSSQPPHWERAHCLTVLADRFEQENPQDY